MKKSKYICQCTRNRAITSTNFNIYVFSFWSWFYIKQGIVLCNLFFVCLFFVKSAVKSLSKNKQANKNFHNWVFFERKKKNKETSIHPININLWAWSILTELRFASSRTNRQNIQNLFKDEWVHKKYPPCKSLFGGFLILQNNNIWYTQDWRFQREKDCITNKLLNIIHDKLNLLCHLYSVLFH